MADGKVNSPPPVMPAPSVAEAEPGIGRRGFLRSTALGAVTLLVLGDGVIAYRAYDQGVLGEARGRHFERSRTGRTTPDP